MDKLVGNRIIVLGSPGSGKSTLSVRLHARTNLPLVHLDNIWWRPDRTHITREEFDRRLAEIMRGERWILDGNYRRTYEMRLRNCDTVIFLDYDTEVCMHGINSRIGKPRPDMPWVETGLDPELAAFVQSYKLEERPLIISLLEKYASKRRLVFRTREESDTWLSSL